MRVDYFKRASYFCVVMKNKRILSYFISVLLLSSCGIGKTICELSLNGPMNGRDFNDTRNMVEGRYPGINAWYDSLRAEGVFRDTVILGEGGVDIHAIYAGREGSRDAVVLCHGYGVNHIAMLHFARLYRDTLGFNVIVPDLQHHGLSGGDAASMGYYDSRDALRWVNMAHALWNSDFVMAHGVSMGSATVMMLSGLDNLPQYLRCFVEDCGYTSVWDQFDFVRRTYTGLNEEALKKADQYCQWRYGWDFRSASPLESVSRCDRPMLFIHGNPDNFVPTESVYKLYAAKTKGYKDIWISEGTTKHAIAYLTNMEAYTDRVKDFIRKVRELSSISQE